MLPQVTFVKSGFMEGDSESMTGVSRERIMDRKLTTHSQALAPIRKREMEQNW
jgi:hypothetical protein